MEPVKELPDFAIQPNGEISKEFLLLDIRTFHQATDLIKSLDYGRNTNKNNLKTVFSDNRGTCSTKHAVLKQLADEHNFKQIKLVLGIFKMNGINTPKVADRLRENNLTYIPEGHNYLKYKNQIFDFTKLGYSPLKFVTDLLFEIEIQPDEIHEPKMEIHKKYLVEFLKNNKTINYSLDELWAIREKCIQDLSS